MITPPASTPEIRQQTRWVAAAGSAIAWLIALGPLEARELVVPFGPLHLTSTELLAAFAAAVGLIAVAVVYRRRLATWTRVRARLGTPFAFALALWALLHLASAAWAGEGALFSLKFGLRVAGGVALAGVTLALGAERVFIRRLSIGVAGGVAFVTAIAAFERLGGQAAEPLLTWFRDEPTWMLGEQRLSAVFYHANTLAAWLEIVVPWLVAAVIAPRSQRLPRAALLAASLVMLSLTYSRAGLAAGLVGCGLVALGASFGGHRSLKFVAIIAGAVLALSYLANPDMRGRLGLEDRGYQASYRVDDVCIGQPGERVEVEVCVRNDGEWPLSNRQAPGDLAHVAWPAEGRPAAAEFHYQPLPAIDPGESVTLTVAVDLPDQPGVVDIVVDIRRKNVIWLSAVGVEPGRIQCIALAPGETAEQFTRGDGDGMPSEIHLQGRPLELERKHYWQAALRLWGERPFFGQGADQFRHRYGRFVPERGWDDRARSHSIIMETAANLGFAGLLALGLLAGSIAVALWRPFRLGAGGPVAIGVAAGVLSFLVHHMVDYFLGYTKILVVFWPLLGAAVSLALSPRAVLTPSDKPETDQEP